MHNQTKDQALSVWHELLTCPPADMSALNHYEELLRLADYYNEKDVISVSERQVLIELATVVYFRSVEALACSGEVVTNAVKKKPKLSRTRVSFPNGRIVLEEKLVICRSLFRSSLYDALTPVSDAE